MGALALLSVAACGYKHHEGVLANGASSQLFFSGSVDAANEVLAVGYAATIKVARYSAGDVSCTGLGTHKNAVASGELRIQGGDLGDTDHCDSKPADAVTLISAECTDDTCVVTADTTDPRAVTLTVTGAHAGPAHLAVSLKSNDDGHTYDDSIALRFGAPSRIRLAADTGELDAMNGPVLPGVGITMPRASVVDAAGERLAIADDALKATTEGDAYANADTPGYRSFEARHAGHTVLRWTYPGVPDRTLDLEVVDPSEAHALFVYAPFPARSAGTVGNASDVDPGDAPRSGEPSTGRITSIELAEYAFGTFPVRVKLADGRFALTTLGAPLLTPASIGSTSADLDPSALEFEAKLVGDGTLTVRAAAGTSTTLAVKVTARPPR